LQLWSIIKKSFYNAICAFSYISAAVFLLFRLQNPNVPDDKSIIVPMAILSLFVLSVAMMGYFFVWGPLELVIEGKKEESVKYFFTTIGIFVGMAFLVILYYLVVNNIIR
jgi:hypothetical protein